MSPPLKCSLFIFVTIIIMEEYTIYKKAGLPAFFRWFTAQKKIWIEN